MGHDRFGLVVVVAAPADASPAVLAMDQRSVRLDGVAIHEPGSVDLNFDSAIGIPGQQAAVGNVRPEQPFSIRLPRRALPVDRPVIELKQGPIEGQDFDQPIIIDLDARKRIDGLWRPGAAKQATGPKICICAHLGTLVLTTGPPTCCAT
jgi:hypothetical protein